VLPRTFEEGNYAVAMGIGVVTLAKVRQAAV